MGKLFGAMPMPPRFAISKATAGCPGDHDLPALQPLNVMVTFVPNWAFESIPTGPHGHAWRQEDCLWQ
jgi:hypothetical protein